MPWIILIVLVGVAGLLWRRQQPIPATPEVPAVVATSSGSTIDNLTQEITNMFYSLTQDGKQNEEKYASAIANAEQRYHLPDGLLHRLLFVESHFRSDIIGVYPDGGAVPADKRTVSSAGAKGIAQFTDSTAGDFALNQWNPIDSINAAGQYLQRLYRRFGSWRWAVAAYNAGPGNVKKYNGVPPFAETQQYVASIADYVGVA